eukprot:3695127-Rhodomonas_salina.1
MRRPASNFYSTVRSTPMSLCVVSLATKTPAHAVAVWAGTKTAETLDKIVHGDEGFIPTMAGGATGCRYGKVVPLPVIGLSGCSA